MRGLILVEGQTEERLIKDTIAPAFWPWSLFLEPTILVTKMVKDGPNFKGGVTSYERCRNDLAKLLNSSGGALVTTMLDYYGLPSDFPGMSTRPNGSPRERASHVQQAIWHDFGEPQNFVPFLALHEFEAWLFSCPSTLPDVLTVPTQQPEFARLCNCYDSPEDINDGHDTAPSKRIMQMFPTYKKTLHGPTAAKRIGLNKIRSACPHFDDWLQRLEAMAPGPPPSNNDSDARTV